MVPLRFSFGAFLVLGFAAACSSSSSPPSGTVTPGGDASTTPPADGGNPPADGGNPLAITATCGLFSAVGGGGDGGSSSCPSGQTCCTVLLPPSASCVAVGSCTGVSNECSKGSDCAGGKVCCAGAADGGTMAAMTDAGPPGLLGGFDPSIYSSTCQSSCTATQMQDCGSDTECAAGQTRQAARRARPSAPASCQQTRADLPFLIRPWKVRSVRVGDDLA